ncbi:laminin subunit beta-1 [Latimeria chalumnae]|uniref:laminin subunit beta-1 n=1 Tax=Latimeria chalumnae TaxID=7897 RepID=UPI00313EC1F0
MKPKLLATIFVMVSAQSALAQDQPSLPQGCTEGSCYPATGNLLIGRAHGLSVTSTCGLQGAEEYCIVSHLQDSDKCFYCHSYDPQQSHQIQNVIYLTNADGEKTWWQAENGVEKVSIRLNLEAEFHFTHLIMKFKTFRPAAMLIERSVDFGLTWKAYRYFSYNCTKMFPGIRQTLRKVDDVICENRYSDIEPSTEGEVIYKVLDPAVTVEDPYSLEIQDLLRITNLRINFTKLHTLGDNLLDQRKEVLAKYYYAVYELVVRGSCFCYGHASECAPVEGVRVGVEGMIHGRCVCKHNTKGLNCENCRDFYHDLPWRPAEANNPHTCRQCDCNNHSRKCHFDMAVYLATGNVSGGVCDNCLHNTMGRNCEICKPFYYRNPMVDIRTEGACIPCDCDPVGSLDGGICDSHTDFNLRMLAGQCRCKENVKGTRCDSCKEGFYGLSENDPQGCQPCRCDPRGIVLSGPPCDQISGDCYCKRYVTGRYCGQCLPEYWGLSSDITGCRPCDCDFGGAYNNRCLMENGHCDCRPHLIGRQCDDVQLGYFCMPLDYYTYEAEDATPHSPTDQELPGEPRPEAQNDCLEYYNGVRNGRSVRLRRPQGIARALQQRAALRRTRQLQRKPDVETIRRPQAPNKMITWTGPGFARVKDGAGLVFKIDNIPYSMEYDIMIRYEPESAENWQAIVSITSESLPMSHRCGNILPSEQMYSVSLQHQQRYLVLPRPFCFETNNRYIIAIRFQRDDAKHRHVTAFILIDSLVLLPKYTELPGFHGNDPSSVHHREEMERYMCLDSFKMATMPTLAEMCIKLICSVSAIIHDGALPCECDPQGSTSAVCEKIGGQCKCKPNVIGRHCDQCAPGTYGFGPSGCYPCNCHSHGSVSDICDPSSGQCRCQHGAIGRQCDQCLPGQWGFPNCRPCQCNSHSEVCNSKTGTCMDCRDYTTGRHCERCLDGYFGNPVLGSGEQCRPCPCPRYPGSGHYHGNSCDMDQESNEIVCHCVPGYTGLRCDRCSPGYFGNPALEGSVCRPCQCNNNIETSDPGACDPQTGTCLRCLFNTDGPSCAECKLGYYGNALLHSCRQCTCNLQGTLDSHCTQDGCYCDRVTGNCPCRPNVIGRNCDQCAPNHWDFSQGPGCQPCACNVVHAVAPSCNMFTGQCHCQPGFGGRDCSKCQENFWGNPERECKACDCDINGVETLQCNHSTGQCYCREGVTGPICNQCARGFHGNFPQCAHCHPCFHQWDQVVMSLQAELEGIKRKVSDIIEGGLPDSFDEGRMKALEDKLAQIQELISSNGTSLQEQFNHVFQLENAIRRELSQLSRKLEKIQRQLSNTELSNQEEREKLRALEDELRTLNESVHRFREQLKNAITSGFTESYNSILKYYQESASAERQGNASVLGPESPVGQSASTRNETEALLKKHKDEFRRTAAAQKKSLKELDKKVQTLTVAGINEKVCGAPGHASCAESPCGGANCRDNLGNRVCGGKGCDGAVPTAVEALKKVQNVSKELTNKGAELDAVSQKIQQIQEEAQDTKEEVEKALSKAQEVKDRIASSTEELRNFIKKIKDFLNEEGADPESIELVARQVLNISLPASASDIAGVLKQIKDSISNVSNVDQILNATAENLQALKDLLKRANEAKERAEGVNTTIESTRQTLDTITTKLDSTQKSLKKAQKNIKAVRNSITKVNDKVSAIGEKQMDAMNRLANLSKEVDELKNKMELNRKMAAEAKEKADKAAVVAKDLNEVMEEVEKKYTKLKKQIEGLDDDSGDAASRVHKVKKEAEDLLKKARSDLEKLKDLENKFQQNRKNMEEKIATLQELEQKANDLVQYIRNKSSAYASCTS